MTTLTKQQVIVLKAKLDALLKQFGEEHNLVVGKTSGSFSSTTIDVKVSMSTKESNPNEVDPRLLKDLKSRGWQLGLTEDMIGTIFKCGGETFKFSGMRASKIVARSTSSGIDYKFDPTTAPVILAAFANKA